MCGIKIIQEGNHKIIDILGLKIKFKNSDLYVGYRINGFNNKIIIVENGIERELKKHEKIKGLDIVINGNNNFIKINCNNFLASSIKLKSSGTKIFIDKTDRLYGLNISTCCGNNQVLKWGEGSNTWGTNIYLNEENASCTVGKNCMFSGSINIWPTDGHAIMDINSGKVINLGEKGVIIGDNCWIGQNAHFTKNSIIKNGTIVGAHSVVTKEFHLENIIIAGNPAKIIKENVTWARKTAYMYAQENTELLSNTEMVKDVI